MVSRGIPLLAFSLIPPKQHNFRGPGGFGGDVGTARPAKICDWELISVVRRGLPLRGPGGVGGDVRSVGLAGTFGYALASVLARSLPWCLVVSRWLRLTLFPKQT